MEILGSNSPTLNNFFCSSGKCFGGWRCGFVSLACFQLCLWGHKALTFPSPTNLSPSVLLSLSQSYAPVSLISQIPFSPKQLEECRYFLNLRWGEGSCRASVWLTGKHAGNTQRFSVCLGLLLLAAQTEPEKQRTRAQDVFFFLIYWTECFLDSMSLSVHQLSLSLLSHCLISSYF